MKVCNNCGDDLDQYHIENEDVPQGFCSTNCSEMLLHAIEQGEINRFKENQ